MVIKILRWLAVIPSAVVIYFVANLLVGISWRYIGEDSILGFIPIVYVVELAKAAIAPWAAVRAGGYVAGTGKVPAAGLVAVIFVVFTTVAGLGLVAIRAKDLYSELPLWFNWVILVVTLISACAGVYSEYEEFVNEQRVKDREEITNELRPFYKVGKSASMIHSGPGGTQEEDDGRSPI